MLKRVGRFGTRMGQESGNEMNEDQVQPQGDLLLSAKNDREKVAEKREKRTENREIKRKRKDKKEGKEKQKRRKKTKEQFENDKNHSH